MAASKLQMHESPLPYKISTKFQRLYLCFWGSALQWDSRDYNATLPEVEKCKMAAYKLWIHVSPLARKISTQLQRLYTHIFWVQISNWTIVGTGSRKDGNFWTSNNHMHRLASLSKLWLSSGGHYQKTCQSVSPLRNILCFPLPVWSHITPISSSGMLDLKNVGFAVGIPLISCLRAQRHAIEVERSPSWICPLPVWPTFLRSSSPLELVGMMCDQTGSGKHEMFRKCETVWVVFW